MILICHTAAVSGPITIEALFAAHSQHVIRRARQMMGNQADAEEVAQDVFVRAMKSLDRFDGRSPASWLYQITTNECLNRIRNASRRRELFREHVQPMIKEGVERSPDNAIMLRWLMANADEQQARCASYVYLDGLTYPEVAQLMGVSRRTVNNLMDRFRAWARQQVQELKGNGHAARRV